MCLGGCVPTNIRIFCRDTGQLIIITIPRMHTLHVFLLASMCVWMDQGRLHRPEETSSGFARLPLDFRIYHPLCGQLSLSLSLSRVLSSLPYRDLWNVSNRTAPTPSRVKRPDCWSLALGQTRVSLALNSRYIRGLYVISSITFSFQRLTFLTPLNFRIKS